MFWHNPFLSFNYIVSDFFNLLVLLKNLADKYLINDFQSCNSNAKKPPTIPALPAPIGQPTCPQNGQTANMAYRLENPNHQAKNLITFPSTVCCSLFLVVSLDASR